MLITKYTPFWIEKFESLKSELESYLQGINCVIEHVGSTAVPNLDAKNIIDIDIIYFLDTDFEHIKSGLERAGYYHNGDQGISQREVFKRAGASKNQILDSIIHHLYVCPVGSLALERHLLSRDFLRKNEWARQEYQAMKYKLADKANQNKKQYAELKELYTNEFIDRIVAEEKLSTLDKLTD